MKFSVDHRKFLHAFGARPASLPFLNFPHATRNLHQRSSTAAASVLQFVRRTGYEVHQGFFCQPSTCTTAAIFVSSRPGLNFASAAREHHRRGSRHSDLPTGAAPRRRQKFFPDGVTLGTTPQVTLAFRQQRFSGFFQVGRIFI